LIVDDHTIIRQGLRSLVESYPGYEIVGEASDGLEAISIIEELSPDLVLMDLSLPKTSGLEVISEIRARRTDLKIVVLTVHSAEEHVLAAFKAGANGYVLKYANIEELLLAMKSVMGGKYFISPMISGQVLEGYLEHSQKAKESSTWEALTTRERQILTLISEGHKNKEIAGYLYISPKTVETHRTNIMRKLDLHSASELTAYALKRGLTAA